MCTYVNISVQKYVEGGQNTGGLHFVFWTFYLVGVFCNLLFYKNKVVFYFVIKAVPVKREPVDSWLQQVGNHDEVTMSGDLSLSFLVSINLIIFIYL